MKKIKCQNKIKSRIDTQSGCKLKIIKSNNNKLASRMKNKVDAIKK